MIHIRQNGRSIAARGWDGAPVDVAALLCEAGVSMRAPCGGRGQCGKCTVRVAGDVSAPTEAERARLSAASLKSGVRLACEACVTGPDASIDIGDERAMTGELYGARTDAPFRPWGKRLGFAADIGTTTVAAYLFDLADGAALGATLAENPQRAFGADVITRLEYAVNGGMDALALAVRRCVATLAESLCAAAGREPAEIDAAVLTGNTAMLYFLCGIDAKGLARHPFIADELFGRSMPAKGLFDAWSPGCRVYLPRCISAFVGADITCAILAAGLNEQAGPAMLADIGTNGEIVCKHGARLLCCSTAAGPAFEGAGIERGSVAVRGAVDAVWREAEGLNYHVIQGGPAVSLCGSGALDMLACLLKTGDVDETGLLRCPDSVEGRPAYRLGGEAWLTQQDVRALQLAKAAIRAGMETLRLRAGLTGAVDTLYLAGGFGNRLDAESAFAIGLLPGDMRGRIRPIGNAAGMGAVRLLLDFDALAASDALAKAAETAPLAGDGVFSAQFVERMAFGGD